MRGVVTKRRWADFEIPAPLLPVCSHILALTFHKLYKIFSWNLCIAEIALLTCLMRISNLNFVCMCPTYDVGHTQFQLKNLLINVFSAVVYFRDIILVSSRNVSETAPCISMLLRGYIQMTRHVATIYACAAMCTLAISLRVISMCFIETLKQWTGVRFNTWCKFCVENSSITLKIHRNLSSTAVTQRHMSKWCTTITGPLFTKQ